MSRYIDAELADKLLTEGYSIDEVPTADVEEVKTAVFEECANNSGYKCSRCKARVKIRDVVNETHKYCYKCGARFVGVVPIDDEF